MCVAVRYYKFSLGLQIEPKRKENEALLKETETNVGFSL